jgi:hypothetical protein
VAFVHSVHGSKNTTPARTTATATAMTALRLLMTGILWSERADEMYRAPDEVVTNARALSLRTSA